MKSFFMEKGFFMKNKLPFFSLLILIISAIDNMKNMPAAALFGSPLVFFFLFAAIFFLFPTAYISAKLSTLFSQKGGVYHWVGEAFGERFAMAAIWLQWINTIVWYPTMLSFIAGASAYLLYPELAENNVYLISFILILFWALTWINLKGIQVSSKFTNVCSLIGTILPMGLLILLGAIWVISKQPLQIHLTPEEMLPNFTNTASWTSLVAIMASFLGMELSGVHLNEIHQPQKNFPRATLIAAFYIFLSMGLSTLSIALVLPKEEINLISGVVQVFSNFFSLFGLNSLTPLVALSIALGSIGTMVNWLISPAKGLLQAAEYGFLPAFFTRTNRVNVASSILLIQALLVSLICLLFLLLPNIGEFFWFLTALSTELYMLMYILMFCSGIKLLKSSAKWVFSLFGLTGSIVTIIISFFPPPHIDIGSPMRYLFLIVIGNVFTLSPILWFYRFKGRMSSVRQ